MLKYNFGYNELGLPVVLSIHVSSLASDISNAVIVCDGKLLEVSKELMSLGLKSLNVSFHIYVLVVDAKVLPVKTL